MGLPVGSGPPGDLILRPNVVLIGSFKHQRLGQAFYNHPNLHKLTDQASLRSLYEADGEKTSGLIRKLFHCH
jgi:hypothetical protein